MHPNGQQAFGVQHMVETVLLWSSSVKRAAVCQVLPTEQHENNSKLILKIQYFFWLVFLC
jgi:hypothetical protein